VEDSADTDINVAAVLVVLAKDISQHWLVQNLAGLKYVGTCAFNIDLTVIIP
jgi:hypothetical protein